MKRIKILTVLRELNCNDSGIYWCEFNGEKVLLVRVKNNAYTLSLSYDDAQLLRIRDDVRDELVAITAQGGEDN
jgi:hypothetical protein